MPMKKIILTFFILSVINIYSYEELIGSTPGELIEKIGAPEHVYAERGKTYSEDDVVLFYKNRLYVYFNKNRAWQVRADEKFTDKFLELKIGLTLDETKQLLGEPMEILGNSLIYKRPDRGYPVFLRLYFKGEKLDDIYVYRGDY